MNYGTDLRTGIPKSKMNDRNIKKLLFNLEMIIQQINDIIKVQSIFGKQMDQKDQSSQIQPNQTISGK